MKWILPLSCPYTCDQNTHLQISSNWRSPYIRQSIGFTNRILQYLTKYPPLCLNGNIYTNHCLAHTMVLTYLVHRTHILSTVLTAHDTVMRKLRAKHPSWTWNMGKLFGWTTSQNVPLDAKGMMMELAVMPRVERSMDNYALLKNQQCKLPWSVHQRKAVEKYGRCCWIDCPGKRLSKANYPRNINTHMRCKECSTYLGNAIFLCKSFIKGAPVNCHRHYHIYHHNKEFASTRVIK